MTQVIPQKARRAAPSTLLRCAALLFPLTAAFASIAASSFSWPHTSRQPVPPLAQPTLESKLAHLTPGPDAGYSFVAFGDQRALAGGEWESMMTSIDSLSRQDPRLLFMLDTGDIVDDGSHTDQFRALAGILARARSLPYLVGVGNHEVDNNEPGPSRLNTAAFLKPLDASLGPNRLYYRRTVGRVRFLFLDSNDLVYEPGPNVKTRREAQLAWLVKELKATPDEPGHPTVVVMHHPFLQSSEKHREQARALWSLTYEGRTLPDILADGGVDLVLVGHTHTYERFRATRRDGKGFHLVNFSGRPLPVFLWIGDGQRRANEIQSGAERLWFYERGWRNVDGWDLTQEEAMTKHESDQFAVLHVEPDGGLTMSLRYMNRPGLEAPIRLLWGGTESSAPAPATPAR